ncbi:MAG TPA: phosphoribosylglycinamide formyltransferase [Ferruginibacter sp.]|nr:phosphoribosylglycinamide formyltransferase [Ferruginibacter sp.]
MFERLKHHWRVSGLSLALILLTFALGGSLCGYAGRRVLLLLHVEKGALWVVLYIILICLLWPLCVLLISIPFGQFKFFKRYIIRIWDKMRGRHKIRIAIFASGAGSNAQRIIDRFNLSSKIKVALIVCNKPGAGVLTIAQNENIPALLIKKEQFFEGDGYLPELQKGKIDFIVLAGFLWKLPETLIRAYPNKIINIHPALLPKYGGAGMYGHYVHEAVLANKEKESGISIHYVDELYDHGKIIHQATCIVEEHDDVSSLTKKVHALEHEHYPAVIKKIITGGRE